MNVPSSTAANPAAATLGAGAAEREAPIDARARLLKLLVDAQNRQAEILANEQEGKGASLDIRV